MATKKKPDEVAETPKENLITVVSVEWFSDGNLQDFMKQYGYECEWPAGQSRSLPMWLIRRCINSGAELDQV